MLEKYSFEKINIYVIGIGHGSDGNTELLNSLAYYEDSKNKWVAVEPQSKVSPEPRYGMRLFCYYNYIIMFGGTGKNETYYGDLWIFDIIRSHWIKLQDSPSGYEISNDNEESTPINRAFFGGELLIKYGSAIIFGGKGDEDTTFCDIWSLDIEKAVLVHEDPTIKEIGVIWK